jgi:hypothetical protein
LGYTCSEKLLSRCNIAYKDDRTAPHLQYVLGFVCSPDTWCFLRAVLNSNDQRPLRTLSNKTSAKRYSGVKQDRKDLKKKGRGAGIAKPLSSTECDGGTLGQWDVRFRRFFEFSPYNRKGGEFGSAHTSGSLQWSVECDSWK